jgi:hypothetical protein
MPNSTAIPLVLMLAIAGCQSTSPVPSTAPSHWVQTQMFFGLTGPGGTRLADADWHDFIDHSITPRFPDGLTLIYGDGQYRGDDGIVHKEPSAILILLHPPADDIKLDEIARDYDRRFHQQSVLRVDMPAEARFVAAGRGAPAGD